MARPNRFLVLAQRAGRDGEVVQVHCPDPGRLRELLFPGARIYISRARTNSGTRRTEYDLRFVFFEDGNTTDRVAASPGSEPGGRLVSLNTTLPNRLMGLALQAGIPALVAAPLDVKAEVQSPHTHTPGSRSRFDYLVRGGDGSHCWVEVKSATLVEDGVARFPDAPTLRGQRHLHELTRIVHEGVGSAAVVFVVQRSDATALVPNAATDPAFADALADAHAAGVKLFAYTCDLTPTSIRLAAEIPVVV